MKITILGCGPSGGVPLPHGDWGDCDPQNPKNNRTRTSIAIQNHDQVWLVDTSPDLRAQMLREKITRVDGVLYTHGHADHINGIDDLRPLYFAYGQKIPLYADAHTAEEIKTGSPYLFRKSEDTPALYAPFLDLHEITGPFELSGLGLSIIPFIQDHGYRNSLGFRLSSFAYSTDLIHLNEEAFRILEGIDVWIVGCLGLLPHATHAHLNLVLEWIKRIRPKRTIITHMNQELDYETLRQSLPPGVEPAYDGMTIEIDEKG